MLRVRTQRRSRGTSIAVVLAMILAMLVAPTGVAGAVDPDPPRDRIAATIPLVEDLLPTGMQRADRQLGYAIVDIERSLYESLWTSDDDLGKYGFNLFNAHRRAIRLLRGSTVFLPHLVTPVADVIDMLVMADFDLVLLEIARAETFAPPGALADAWAQVDGATADYAGGQPDKAAAHLREAWKLARAVRNSVPGVRIVGPGHPDDADMQAFVSELNAFGTASGLGVVYEQFSSVEEAVFGPDPADLVIVPTPGALRDYAGEFVDLRTYVDEPTLRSDFGDYLIDLVSTPDKVVGVPISVDLKSTVWYSPAAFAAHGYPVPTTFAELVALSDAMVADGLYPWCGYMESGFATGWLGTDWIEDLLLGAEGPLVYDGWVDGSVIFPDPRIENAFLRFQQMIDTSGYVFDRANMLHVFFGDNAFPLVAGDCMMHRQATFLRFFGPDLIGSGFETFQFPSVDPAFSDAAMGGALFIGAATDSDPVAALIEFISADQFGTTAMAQSGFAILPRSGFDLSLYPDDLVRSWAAAVGDALAAGQFRFDASDQMPPPVNDAFWRGIVDLVAGVKTIPQVLVDIQATWP